MKWSKWMQKEHLWIWSNLFSLNSSGMMYCVHFIMFQAHRTLVVHIAYKYSRTLPPQLQNIWPCVYHTAPVWRRFRDSSWPAGICPKGIRLVDHNILHTPSQRWYLLCSRWCMERLWPWSQPEVTDGWRHKTIALICLDLWKHLDLMILWS